MPVPSRRFLSLPILLVLPALFPGCIPVGMTDNGEHGTCTYTKPTPDTVHLDSLVLLADTRCFDYFGSTGRSFTCDDSYTFQASPTDTALALPWFFANDLWLSQDGGSIVVPEPRYAGETHSSCAQLEYTRKINLSRVTPRMSVDLQVLRNSDDSARKWRIEVDYDTAKVPAFQVTATSTALNVTVTPKAGTEVNLVAFRLSQFQHVLRTESSASPVTVQVALRDIKSLHNWRREDITGLQYDIGADVSGIQTLKVDGRVSKQGAWITRAIEGAAYEALKAYASKHCHEC